MNVVLFVQIAFNGLMGFFISYYILKFSKDSARNNHDSKDSLSNSLERAHVPNLVYM